MKTRIEKQKLNVNGLIFVMMATLMFSAAGAFAQEEDPTQSLFSEGIEVSELWAPEIKMNSIQGGIGTLIGGYGGVLIKGN